jgi:Zn finger protein HypA/HybF involved in hydrogenase expression
VPLSVKVSVGELSAVEPDLLKFAWQALPQDTESPWPELEIIWCPAQVSCPLCGRIETQGLGGLLTRCPDCGHSLQVEGGDQLHIVEVVLDQAQGESDE